MPVQEPGSLPFELTSFVGRERMLAELERLLSPESPGCRLLTLTGPGGSGKTRVALRVAAALRQRFDDGVYFVALAPIVDPRLVAVTIAQAVGVRDAGGQAVLESLANFLRDRHVLLVVDNFEQVLGAALDIRELLATCPRLQVIVTSRAALRLSGERELGVEPLQLPGPGRTDGESVQLFVDRAQAVKADFELTADTAPVVAEICRRLDGLPLAIELAAARVRLLDPESMLARLEHRLRFLVGGARDLPARQQTLSNTLAWSYDLLDAHEQTLFRSMAVFAGGCTLEAAQAVSADEGDVLDAVDSLVAKNLARSVGPGEVRITMLETTREFGLEQLAWTGELDTVRRRHAEYFLALAERIEPELWGPAASRWHARLEAEHDNLRAALDWGLAAGDETRRNVALRLAGALARFWWTRGHFGEGLQWLARALAIAPARSAARAKALHAAGWLAHFLHDSATARALLEESLSIARELGDTWTEAWVLHVLGRVAYFDGDYPGARALGEQSLALAESLGDRWLIAWAVHLLGLAAHIAGDYATADERYAQSMAIRRALGHREMVGVLCQLMGMSAYRQGDFLKARALYCEYLDIAREFGSTFHLSMLLAQFGSLAAVQGQPERATRLLAAAAVFHETSGTRPIPLTAALVGDGVGLAREAWARPPSPLPGRSAERCRRRRPLPRRWPSTSRGSAPDRSEHQTAAGPLTQREQQVATLIARGWTNRQIAAELVVSERTVATHVEHILSKLDFVSRTQIGVWISAN